jgi:hypothetical protein
LPALVTRDTEHRRVLKKAGLTKPIEKMVERYAEWVPALLLATRGDAIFSRLVTSVEFGLAGVAEQKLPV